MSKGFLEEAKQYTKAFKNSQVIEKALKAYVKLKKSPPKRRVVLRTKKNSRYIPRAVKNEVRQRDQGQCTFVSPDGVRCCETHGLEFDHVIPYSCGGGRTTDNLRLRCKAHNMLFAEEFFGKEKITKYRRHQRS